jgi:hypothetical protein
LALRIALQRPAISLQTCNYMRTAPSAIRALASSSL